MTAATRVSASAPVSSEGGASILLLSLIALGVGLAALAFAAAAAPVRLLPPDTRIMLVENRTVLVLVGLASIAGLAVGLLIGLTGS